MNTDDVIVEIEKNKSMNKNELYQYLTDIFPKQNVDFVMFDLFQYIHKNTENKEKRKDQYSFKKDLIDRYKRCIITRASENVCEACHIIPYSKCEDKDKYNVNNGLLFRADFHKLFDNGHLKIDPITLQMNFSNEIMNDEFMQEYKKYDGKKINIHEKSICFLNKMN